VELSYEFQAYFGAVLMVTPPSCCRSALLSLTPETGLDSEAVPKSPVHGPVSIWVLFLGLGGDWTILARKASLSSSFAKSSFKCGRKSLPLSAFAGERESGISTVPGFRKAPNHVSGMIDDIWTGFSLVRCDRIPKHT
jgi:hypothetical protein